MEANIMAIPQTAKLNEDPCPVTEQLFGELRQASPPEAAGVAKTLPEPQRAELAIFCYNKSHLHALGLEIASTCDRNSLVKAGGVAGDVLYQQSRDPKNTLSAELPPSRSHAPKPISLAGPDGRLNVDSEF